MRAFLLATILFATMFAGCANNADPQTPTATPTAGNEVEVREDTKAFTLAPRQNIEWKFRIEEGKPLEYSWSASRPVSFDFHGDYDDGTDDFVSHKQASLASDQDTFIVPFTGRHGWYFANGNAQSITITLHTKGAYEVVGKTGGNAP